MIPEITKCSIFAPLRMLFITCLLMTLLIVYFRECKRDQLDSVALNEEVQEKLWTETMNLLKIKSFGQVE